MSAIPVNYKLAFNWDVMDGVKLRGNMSTSFVAPGLDQIGNQYHAFIGTTFGSTTAMDGIPIPVAAFPVLTQFAPSQFNNGQACTLASVTCVLASTVQGVNIHGGAAHGHPALGRGWEVGTDITPSFLPGFLAKITYWDTEFLAPLPRPAFPTSSTIPRSIARSPFIRAGRSGLLVYSQSVGLTQTSALPPNISVITYTNVGNYLYLYAAGFDISLNYTWETDWGTFGAGGDSTLLTKYNTGLGATGVPYSILNTTGASASFPSTSVQGRLRADWAQGPYSVDLFANYVGPYRNWSGVSISPLIANAQGNPSGGGDPVRGNLTFDLHLGYDFKDGLLGDDHLNITVVNIANEDPPFYLGSTGYDNWVGKPAWPYYQGRSDHDVLSSSIQGEAPWKTSPKPAAALSWRAQVPPRSQGWPEPRSRHQRTKKCAASILSRKRPAPRTTSSTWVCWRRRSSSAPRRGCRAWCGRSWRAAGSR